MSPFAALVTGSIAGALMKASADDGFILIDVSIPIGGSGNYLNEIHVRGKESGEWLKVTVEPMEAPDQRKEK